ncbi:MAG: sensor histidine kinase, partial [Acidobacteriota bacterium]
MSDPLRVLVVEDSEEDCDLLLRELRRSGWTPEWERVETAAAMSRALGEREWDVVISDFRMPAFSAPAALELLQASGLDVPFLIVSGTVGEEAAVEALKSGADDFLLKQKLTRLASAVRRELREAANRRARRRAEAEKAEAERRLRHAQKLEAVGRLAGGIAHDFNNVLQAMLALVQLLRLGGPRHDLDERLAEMESHVRRGAQLTRQLLLFSRHEAPSRRRVDACGVLDGAGAILRRLIPATIDTRVERPAEAVAIEADPGQLEQVLMNLAINAADAMPEGGVLTLRLEQPDASRV